MRFQLSQSSLSSETLRSQLHSDHAGAFCSFEGRVRNHHEGKSVLALQYEAHEALCAAEAHQILKEVEEKFGIIDCLCAHRVGHLNVGELAVWVGVISAHRDEGFKACRYLIDEIKKRLPIWKKEFYQDGTTAWVNCSCQEVHQ